MRLGVWAMALCLAGSVNAIEVNTLFAVANDDGVAMLTLNNDQQERLYVNVSMAALHVEEGQLVETPYNRSNVLEWEIEVKPSQVVVNPGFERDFKVQLKCGQACDRTTDQVYQVSLLPVPHFPDRPPGSSLGMVFGFAPVIMMPGEERPLDYHIEYRADGTLWVENYSTNYMRLKIEACEGGEISRDCTAEYTVLGGRHLALPLTERLAKLQLAVTLETHRASYRDTQVLTRGKQHEG